MKSCPISLTIWRSAGVGEHAPSIHPSIHPSSPSASCERLAVLGVSIHERRNQVDGPDAEVTATGALVRTLVIATREDLEIGRTRRVLTRSPDLARLRLRLGRKTRDRFRETNIGSFADLDD